MRIPKAVSPIGTVLTMCVGPPASLVGQPAASIATPVPTARTIAIPSTSRPSTWQPSRDEKALLAHLLDQRMEVGAAGAGAAIGEDRAFQPFERGGLVGDVLLGDLAADDRDVAELQARRFRRLLDAVGRRLAWLLVVRAVADDAVEASRLHRGDILRKDL